MAFRGKLEQAQPPRRRALIKVKSPLSICREAPDSSSCGDVFKALRNPYYIGDHPGLTQTSGWVDGWTSQPSAYAVVARKTNDVVAAVNFARESKLRLVVKGGGHSYQGTSCAADSLLVWTREMNAISLQEAFVGKGCEGTQPPLPAVTIEAGALWLAAYEAVTTRAGRYVQGGGCATVGVAGLIQSGGFGSFSKNYGLAAAALLEAEIVTADGVARTANAHTNPDLFWAIKGGGGGSFGVVTRVTLRTRELPQYFGAVFGKICAGSETAFRELISRALSLYGDRLLNPHWGEQMRFGPGNELEIAMVFQGLDQRQAEEAWTPFREWLATSKHEFTVETPLKIVALPARLFWSAAFLKTLAPDAVVADDRPKVPAGNIFWAGDRAQVGQVLYAYRSAWLPAKLLHKEKRPSLVDALFASTRHWSMSLHFNKGLAGAPQRRLPPPGTRQLTPRRWMRSHWPYAPTADLRRFPASRGTNLIWMRRGAGRRRGKVDGRASQSGRRSRLVRRGKRLLRFQVAAIVLGVELSKAGCREEEIRSRRAFLRASRRWQRGVERGRLHPTRPSMTPTASSGCRMFRSPCHLSHSSPRVPSLVIDG